MFRSVPPAPPDPILGLTERFNADPRDAKLNLTVGLYCDDTGRTPVFAAVREAERRLLTGEHTKVYLPIAGSPAFADGVVSLLFPGDSAASATTRVVQAPGGTGALSVAARLIRANDPSATVWLSDPTWPNHGPIFADAGLKVASYRYYDAGTATIDPETMVSDLSTVRDGDAVILHGCCHNPTGLDIDLGTWDRVGRQLAERGALALVDLAYAGLGAGLEPDTEPVRVLAATGVDLAVALSFSKTMGLYSERVGALATVANTAELADSVHSRVKACVRTIYSNPPRHGGSVAASILGDPDLRASWIAELDTMRSRIQNLRQALGGTLAEQGLNRCPRVADGRGMFALTGCPPDQVERLRADHAVYLVANGRMNVAALTDATIPVLVNALGQV